MKRSEHHNKVITIEFNKQDLLDRLNEGRSAEECIPDNAEVWVEDASPIDELNPVIVRYYETYDT